MAVPHDSMFDRDQADWPVPAARELAPQNPALVVDRRTEPDVGRRDGPGDDDLIVAVIPVPAGSRHRSRYARRGKRLFDLVVAGGAVLLALPALALTAIAVRFTMGGPVLFRQDRVGRDGAVFEVLKFRTMKPDRRSGGRGESYRGEERRRSHKCVSHPLLTPLGRFLRTYSLDELPQLFNVVRGEMSVVGPRPELPAVAAGYEPWQYSRLLVRPGLTGFWQIRARGLEPMHRCTDLDVEYVCELSLRTDLAVIIATPVAMFGEHKGY